MSEAQMQQPFSNESNETNLLKITYQSNSDRSAASVLQEPRETSPNKMKDINESLASETSDIQVMHKLAFVHHNPYLLPQTYYSDINRLLGILHFERIQRQRNVN